MFRLATRQRRFLHSTSSVFNTTATLSKADVFNPKTWKGLPAPQILDLYYARHQELGKNYRPNGDELNALMGIASDIGMDARDLKSLYDANEFFYIPHTGKNEVTELPSLAQDLVQEHREQRFYNRLAAHDLPQLVQFRKPYERPNLKTHPITYKYTQYVGEEHPNSKKVVLKCNVAELPNMTAQEQHALKLLATTRYDYQTDVLKFSSDRFPEPRQNAKYLSDVLNKLISEAKANVEELKDIPLDKRHINARSMRKKTKGKINEFPKEWERPQDAPKEPFNAARLILKSKNL